ncbi:perlucin-like protein [Saccoglossus kowalevskii]|uniref:C-type lectin domain family 10 member A-like n=1 Tax=Saccoglossus kowalevskii TaxID=10224 RepID=A0ABM0LZW8_SACKO|nr:PREDICTED: C-type lectin domain family 10 member A-like [Saccoglossus kowalevskii]
MSCKERLMLLILFPLLVASSENGFEQIVDSRRCNLSALYVIERRLTDLAEDMQRALHQVIDSDTGMCPPEWLPFQSSCYWFSPSDVLMNWDEAAEHCNTMNAYLAVPNTPAENMYLYEQCYPLRKYVHPVPGLAMWLLGCTDVENEGTWVCLDNTILSYDAWKSGEPNNYAGNEHRLSLDMRDGAPPAVWNDIISTEWNAQFICERAQGI